MKIDEVSTFPISYIKNLIEVVTVWIRCQRALQHNILDNWTCLILDFLLEFTVHNIIDNLNKSCKKVPLFLLKIHSIKSGPMLYSHNYMVTSLLKMITTKISIVYHAYCIANLRKSNVN